MAATQEIAQETNRGYSIKALDFTPAVTSSITSNPENTIYSRVIPANRMGTSKEMSFNIFCTLTTSLVAPTMTIKVKLGSSVITVVNGLSLSTSITSKPFRIEGAIVNFGSSSSQYVWARIHSPSASLPILLSTEGAFVNTTWTESTTTGKTFSVTAQFGGLIAGTSLDTKYIKIDLS